MEWIISFFKAVGDTIGTVIDFFAWFINSLIESIYLGAQAIATCAAYLAQFPVTWIATFTLIITVTILFKIKG